MKKIESNSYKKITKIAGGHCSSCSPRHNDSTPPCDACPPCRECGSAMKWGGHGNHWWYCEGCNETFDVEPRPGRCEHCGIGSYEDEEAVSDYGTQNRHGDLTHQTEDFAVSTCSHCGYEPHA